MKMKKLFAALLAGVMTLSLVACGGGDTGTSDTTEESTETVGGEENKLVVWAWDQNFNIKAMQIAADQYNEAHPEVEIVIEEVASADIETKLTTAANSGDYSIMPDIALMQDNSYQKFLKSYPDAFVDISDAAVDWENFPELKQSYSTVDGKHYGVPFDNGAVIGCYRTDILAEAGYTIADLTDITWSRFIEIGKDVHAKTGKYLLSSEATGGDLIYIMLQSCGANIVNENGEAFIEGNETFEKCMDLYLQMIQENVLLLVNNWDEYISSVTDEQVAGIVNGNWMTATLMATEDQAGKWEVTNTPAVDDVDTATHYANNGGSSWYVSANCKDVELAKDFLASTFGSSTDFYDAILPETGALASYLPAAETETYQAPVEYFNNQPVFSTIVGYSEFIPVFDKTPYHYEAREIMNTAIVKVSNGEATKEAAIEEAQESLEFKMTE